MKMRHLRYRDKWQSKVRKQWSYNAFVEDFRDIYCVSKNVTHNSVTHQPILICNCHSLPQTYLVNLSYQTTI